MDQMMEIQMVIELGYLSEVLKAIQSVLKMGSHSEFLLENYSGHRTEILKAM